MSAYEVWLSQGNTGTEQDFLNGITGPQGPAGTNGIDGTDGQDGLSAYEVWLSQGNTGTEQDFLDSLVNSADIDSTNEIQSLLYSNDTLYITNGNSVFIGQETNGNSNTNLILEANITSPLYFGTSNPPATRVVSFDNYTLNEGTFDGAFFTTDSLIGAGTYVISLSLFSSQVYPFSAWIAKNGFGIAGQSTSSGRTSIITNYLEKNRMTITTIVDLENNDFIRIRAQCASTDDMRFVTPSSLRIYKLDNTSESGSNSDIDSSLCVNIGDYAHGGIVFYVDSTCMHGKVITPNDIMNYNANSDQDTAEDICFNLTYNSFDDWYLPTIDDLQLVYDNLGNGGFGLFWSWSNSTAYNIWHYWSSTNDIFSNPFVNGECLDFQTGNQLTIGKNNDCRIRAVRNF